MDLKTSCYSIYSSRRVKCDVITSITKCKSLSSNTSYSILVARY